MSAHRILDWIDVPVISGMLIGITFTDVELFMKIFASGLAIGYTLWRWVTEYKKNKDGKDK